MRAYELRGHGLENLALAERPEPRPGPGQLLVRMRAASLNYRDLLIARGRYGRGPVRLPLVPLSDGAGEVVEVGSGVSRFDVGDRVAGAFFQRWVDGPLDEEKAASALGGAVDGVLAEYVVFEEMGVVKIPDHLSFEEAATLPCAGVTAWVGLFALGRLLPGETVLAMGTGGVSIFALQFAKMAGARVILTSSSDEKLARGKRLGADEVINYEKTLDWDLRARELTGGRGVDHILEVGGAKTLPRSLRAVRDGGHITLVGLLSGERADLKEASGNDRNIRVDSVYVGSLRHFEAMLEDIGSNRLHPVVDRVFPFEEAGEAYDYLQSGRHFGKVVIRV
ncbi:Alcohol dehydrogenase [Rubrobacter xylanophilus DSM 9941]|uniref:zinc-dependent alcohol dehydrogenase family protein n=1 Tax=Rubrobacter xylanophilus TaxID=49319 RepID=UPI001C6411DC|nr:NAD(P)-dependent alcohol dehydrogenase [Rubrobacter xylanophilus]QYJ16479.1 Alcohol dehydrogenase [Rubrobacter xylanophilus DSM 9941]